MNQPYHGEKWDLTTFSIAVAYAKNDPEMREAILADGSFQTIWPLIIGGDDRPDRYLDIDSAQPVSGAHTVGSLDPSAEIKSDMNEAGMTGQNSWKSFFSSPQFYVVTSTLVVILAGASMYLKLDEKIDSIRLEVKSDGQALEQRLTSRFDKVDSGFDKVDSRFEVLLNKIDSDSKEIRSLVREGQKQPAS